MAKYCPNCYVGIGADDTVCSNCGYELITDVPVVEAEVIETEEANISDQNEEETIQNEIVDQETPDAKGFGDDFKFENDSSNVPVDHSKPKEVNKVLSLGDWMLTLLLLYIPIVNIIMLIIWSVDAKTNPNKKHFAWAQLIYMAIGIIISIIFSSILIAAIMSIIGSGAYYY